MESVVNAPFSKRHNATQLGSSEKLLAISLELLVELELVELEELIELELELELSELEDELELSELEDELDELTEL
jgi:hypothetical protein